MTVQQDTLFSAERREATPYLLTNRYNLLEILATGAAGPRAAFDKYYNDLLGISPGRLPLLAAPFAQTLVDLVMSEEPMTAFPVALEFESSALTEVPASHGLTGRAIAPPGMLALDQVRAIHFRNQSELDEHAAREYENIRQPVGLYRVSPELFEGGSDGDIAEWLRGLEDLRDDAAEIRKSDRMSGALAMMAATCPASEPAIETIRRSVDMNETRGPKPHAAWLVAAIRGAKRKRSSTDELLMRSALSVMEQSDVSQSWRPVQVLDDVWASFGPEIDPGARDELELHFERMREILRSERPFDRLRPSGLSSEKALLLALMRPDPVRLAGIDAQEMGADWEVVLASAALVGALRGRRRMPVDLRRQELDAFLARREVIAHNKRVESSLGVSAPGPVRLTSRTGPTSRMVRLTAGSAILLERTVVAESGWPEIMLKDLSSPQLLADLAAICQEIGWLDCTDLLVESNEPPAQLAADASAGLTTFVFAGESPIRRAADPARLVAKLSGEVSANAERLRARIRADQEPSPSQRYSN